jgi:hypothetical protein
LRSYEQAKIQAVMNDLTSAHTSRKRRQPSLAYPVRLLIDNCLQDVEVYNSEHSPEETRAQRINRQVQPD